ncbi:MULTISPECIES: hypothetical protein [unclassified Halomonas]|uniref:hypothetical protein n=1 Tax=unclassified Halomonas TaxID=2609666 RepID=UPI000C948668|nr:MULTISPECIES: hypothetical protein [unclassified Halomonas]MAR74200.1 hypothetical protein [Halomonas sp.]
MAYLLVMGSVLLSIGVCLGWACWSLGRWTLGRLLPGGRQSSGTATQKAKPGPRARSRSDAPTKASSKAANKAQAKSEPRQEPRASRGKAAPAKAVKNKEPTPPWALTRGLSRFGSALPLGLLMALIYGVVRLAEKGMAARAESTPEGYHQLVSVLGVTAVALLALALVSRFCRWRLDRYERRQ